MNNTVTDEIKGIARLVGVICVLIVGINACQDDSSTSYDPSRERCTDTLEGLGTC